MAEIQERFKPFHLSVDTKKELISEKIKVSQNDLNSAKLFIDVTQDGNPLPLTNASVKAAFKKPDGKLVFQDQKVEVVDATTGRISIVLTTQTVAVVGDVIGEIHIEELDKRIVTSKFRFYVEESFMSDSSLESTNEFPMFEKVMDAAEQLDGVDVPALVASKETAETALAKTTENTTQIGILSENLNDKTTFAKPKSIVFNNSVKKKPFATIIDDDGRIEALTKLKPLLDSKGVKGNAAIVTSYMLGASSLYMRKTEVDQLKGAGWDIMSHTVSHQHLSTLTDAQILSEIKDSKTILESNGYDVDAIVYPYGDANKPYIHALAKENYKYGFSDFGVQDIPMRSTGIKRITLGSDEALTLDYFKGHVNTAKANNSWLVICTHIGTTSAAQFQILSDLIDYIQSQGIEIVTASEAIKTFGNVLENYNDETGENLTVPIIGGVYSDKINNAFQTKINTGFTASTPITSFEKGKLTSTRFLVADNSGFPSSNGTGTLETYRDIEKEEFSFQKFYSLNLRTVYYRAWDKTNSIWAAWNTFTTRDTVKTTVNVVAKTIPAHSTIDVLLPVASLSTTREMNVYPFSPLEAGVGFCYFYGNSTNVKLRLMNLTAADITTAARDWTVIIS
ncbi:BppU family phage baseplate upper protein [Bacillus sp. DX4.1]|uniref:BppU family phage baseplate upper protein n=1 Tax=Bacillus sp. DX4.1 TaxID=3055867 RepID=UPI0025A1DE04|nr:BppU family phage baseplate upper protein [Bacillus sp. DX4.1]MDM5188625.1 BppU family phage baseplate upper protein [Bacillus sp. DX4.1]